MNKLWYDNMTKQKLLERGINMDKYTLLETYYGYQEFRHGQAELIDQIMAGKDVLGVMPTGAGKSICYQIPALLLQGMSIVISPLISLMQDQVNVLVQNDISAAFINSSLSFSQYKKVLENIKNNQYKILYVAPERLLNEEFMELTNTLDIAMISIDEAHCISHWGQDFRPSYVKIIDFIKRLKKRPVISAFTATATAEVKDDIIAQLHMKDPFQITTGFDRKNLYFEVRHPSNKNKEVCRILQEHKKECGIIYASTRKQVDEVRSMLVEKGFSAQRYHAGMGEVERKNAQNDFLYDRVNIMVATNAFGMGIDKSNVSFVIHYAMPKDMESYYQEAGRAGRDGSAAQCIILYSAGDVRMNQFLIDVSSQNEELDPETAAQIKTRDLERLKIMTFYCHSANCLRQYILKYFGETSDSFCGNCYNCNHNFEEVDISIETQKILSCVKRMEERYGQGMVIDVLRGSRNERLMKLGLQDISTYGIMQDVSVKRLREMIQYVLFHGYLKTSGEEYPVLMLGAKAREILIEKKQLIMKVAKEQVVEVEETRQTHSVNSQLLEQLKEQRAIIAKKQHVPAYIIFNDVALLDMCKVMPIKDDEFLLVNGVGQAKLKKYGKVFMNIIKNFKEKE